jgi:hypothetical protein
LGVSVFCDLPSRASHDAAGGLAATSLACILRTTRRLCSFLKAMMVLENPSALIKLRDSVVTIHPSTSRSGWLFPGCDASQDGPLHATVVLYSIKAAIATAIPQAEAAHLVQARREPRKRGRESLRAHRRLADSSQRARQGAGHSCGQTPGIAAWR